MDLTRKLNLTRTMNLTGKMNRREAVALLGATALAACFSDRPDSTGVNGDGMVVEMRDTLAFSPRTLNIQVGDRVTWRNTSSFVHTATCDPALANDPSHVQLPEGAEAWDSGDVAGGGTFSRTFDVAGEYQYVCLPHEQQGMLGTIVVSS